MKFDLNIATEEISKVENSWFKVIDKSNHNINFNTNYRLSNLIESV